MSEQGELQWYVIRCFGNHERRVKEDLLEMFREEGLLGNKVEQIVIASETVIEMRNGKKHTTEKNMMPGYIFFQGIFDTQINDMVRNINSVIGFLRPNNNADPRPLPESEVNRILGRVAHDREVVASGGLVEIPFKKGDAVKIVDGPFKGYDGTIEEVYPERLKLIVHVSIFGRRTPVEVDVNQVEPE
ncbi:MAG: transcription termination/antitermination protein NusG [Balneolales bacterium]|nr:transcription termination/antitermination protein NusG [Balneolales bacterium]